MHVHLKLDTTVTLLVFIVLYCIGAECQLHDSICSLHCDLYPLPIPGHAQFIGYTTILGSLLGLYAGFILSVWNTLHEQLRCSDTSFGYSQRLLQTNLLGV